MSAFLLVLALLVPGDDPAKAKSLEERLQQENLTDARLWDLYLDSSRKAKAELIERPVYLWTNPTKNGGQYGSVFVWMHQGRPAAIGSIFAHPTGAGRKLVHEFHSLSATVLLGECNDGSEQTWEPKAAVTPQPLADAPPVETTAARRLIQMRAIGREFGGYTVDWRKQRWELRLLPQPLVRYEKSSDDAKDGILDGAVLALVTSAGTDPEVLLLLEARKEGGWHYALLRFSDSSIYVQRHEKEIWTNVRGAENNTRFNNPDHTYRVFDKRLLDASFDGGEAK